MTGAARHFLLIGAQKCGTTWLQHHLRSHPQVFMAPKKDAAHFFWKNTRSTAARAAYREQFSAAKPYQCVMGEATSTYFWTRSGTRWAHYPEEAEENIPRRIRAELGKDLKFLLCLRDPVDRAFSAFIHYARVGDIDIRKPFMESGHYNGIIDMGFYALHFTSWLDVFERSRFLVLNFEQDVRDNPQACLRKVCEFLGIGQVPAESVNGSPIFRGWRRVWRNQQLWVTDDRGEEHVIADWQTVQELRRIYHADVCGLDRIMGFPFSKPWLTASSLP